MDLIHLVKRVCAEVTAEPASGAAGFSAMGLCYLELNAALGTGLGTDWPVTVDHAATMETSWVAALAPELVDVAALPDDPVATTVGVYGPNPRFTVDAAMGRAQIDAAAALLAERSADALRGERLDPFADKRTFVERYWPEPFELAGRAGPASGDETGAALLLTNPGAVSRYLSGLRVAIDGADVPVDGLSLVNPTVGETGVPIAVADLGPERGFYVRRRQTAELRLPVPLAAGAHEVRLTTGLAGVKERTTSQVVVVA
jgi:hypothetical protein